MKTLYSKEDDSINFIIDDGIEARYVRRSAEKLSAYISTQKGCKQACRYCFLTQKGLTQGGELSYREYYLQLEVILRHYVETKYKAKRLNINYMAQGEPLLSSSLTPESIENFSLIANRGAKFRMNDIKHNISSIVPKETSFNKLKSLLELPGVYLYYSLYSFEPKFRKKWMPNAIDPHITLDFIKQNHFDNKIVFHYALINHENDYAWAVTKELEQYKFKNPKFNIVRYNPYSTKQGYETTPEQIDQYKQDLEDILKANVKIIPRVGKDVYASCGMFI